MARTTRKQVEGIFAVFVNSIHGHVATDYNDVGGYSLDYASAYGGYRVERVENEQGGVTTPLGNTRRPATEMWHTLYFATDAIAECLKNRDYA